MIVSTRRSALLCLYSVVILMSGSLTRVGSQLLISSLDRHMTYHVFFQMELLDNWTEFSLQRYGEGPGPEDPELELTETELNW